MSRAMADYANGDIYMCLGLAGLALVGLVVMFGPKVSDALRVIRSADKIAEVPEEERPPDDFDGQVAESIDLVQQAYDDHLAAVEDRDFERWEQECAGSRVLRRLAAQLEERAR